MTESATVYAGELLAAIRYVEHAASKDERRPVLTTVRLGLEREALRITAADNYRIANTSVPVVDVSDAFGPVLVGRADLPQIKAFLAAQEKDAEVRIGRDDPVLTLSAAGGQMTVTTFDGQYPNVDKVIPKHRDAKFRIAFTAKFLREAAKAAEASPSGIVYCAFTESLNPALLSFDGHEEVVMPVRAAS